MEALINLDLLWVGLAVAGAGTLGCSIYFSEPKSATSRAFLFFAVVSILWSVANFASARVTSPEEVLWLIRLVLFFASWHAFAFYVLARQFPDPKPIFSRLVFKALAAWTAAISLWTLTPAVYERVLSVSPTVTQTAPGIALFGLTVLVYIVLGISALFRKFYRAVGEERRQLEFVITGVAITFLCLFVFDFVFPAFLNDAVFVPFGGLFLLPFIAGVAYAILRYRLFNVRVALFGVLTFLLATATFFDVLFSPTWSLILYRTAELLLVLIAGVWLIRAMVREFELERELAETNERQEGLIRFISHEVKGYLTKDMGAFAAILEGDFCPTPDALRPFVETALVQSREGVASVMDILKASNQKKGTVSYTKAPFDLAALAQTIVENAQPAAAQKHLSLSITIDAAGVPYTFTGDEKEIGEHVLRNLVENSLNYTPSGSVEVSLKKENGTFVFSVKDTGIGITPQDKARLFTEGGHGKDSQKVNVHSTGYGLFIAKNITTDHGGTIRAESEGAGKGSTFIVELPA